VDKNAERKIQQLASRAAPLYPNILPEVLSSTKESRGKKITHKYIIKRFFSLYNFLCKDLPLLSFVLLSTSGRIFGYKGAALLASCCIFLSAFLSTLIFFEIGYCSCNCYIRVSPWFHCEMFDVNWGLLFDSFTAIMLIVVNYISFLVHLYSVNYMYEDAHIIRFLSYISIFTFFMLTLVTADNFVQMFYGWEGVGLASYLLINFWFNRIQANKAAIKAILVNRIGDFGLALGIFTAFYLTKAVDFFTIFTCINKLKNIDIIYLSFNINAINVMGIFLFIGAVGKSAQAGLHVWLPDAMEGPTPVSALIHAATMVTAGVFLVSRCSYIYEFTPTILIFIALIGATTSFFAATTGLVQNDLKRVVLTQLVVN
jgi:NADH:ubiquinone oxidoreductase subunit 5 (subunit L)/multisubunit Na+/H+ antiporter MnhA subunit